MTDSKKQPDQSLGDLQELYESAANGYELLEGMRAVESLFGMLSSICKNHSEDNYDFADGVSLLVRFNRPVLVQAEGVEVHGIDHREVTEAQISSGVTIFTPTPESPSLDFVFFSYIADEANPDRMDVIEVSLADIKDIELIDRRQDDRS